MNEKAPKPPEDSETPSKQPPDSLEGEETRIIDGVVYRVTKYPLDRREMQAVRHFERTYGSKRAPNLYETSPNIEIPPNNTGRQKRSKAPDE